MIQRVTIEEHSIQGASAKSYLNRLDRYESSKGESITSRDRLLANESRTKNTIDLRDIDSTLNELNRKIDRLDRITNKWKDRGGSVDFRG